MVGRLLASKPAPADSTSATAFTAATSHPSVCAASAKSCSLNGAPVYAAKNPSGMLGPSDMGAPRVIDRAPSGGDASAESFMSCRCGLTNSWATGVLEARRLRAAGARFPRAGFFRGAATLFAAVAFLRAVAFLAAAFFEELRGARFLFFVAGRLVRCFFRAVVERFFDVVIDTCPPSEPGSFTRSHRNL